MIGLFNIPCESPIELRHSPRQTRFSFPQTASEQAFAAILAGDLPSDERKSRYAKYLLDGRRLLGNGQPVEPLSTAQCWEQLIMRSQLINQSFHGDVDTSPENMETNDNGNDVGQSRLKCSIVHLLEQLIAKLNPRRRHSSMFPAGKSEKLNNMI